MLNFLGNGSCFNTKAYNNSCYYYNKSTSSILLIDCGESIFDRIMQKNLLKNIKNLDILITHFHSDHIGSLPSLIFACEYIYNIVPSIIYPKKNDIKRFLKLSGNDLTKLKIVNPTEYNKFNIKQIKQKHSTNIDAYGYLLHIENKTIFYSGDSNSINNNILKKFLSKKIDYIYQDVTIYENNAHLNIYNLNKIIPKNLKKNVICMHFDNDKIKEIAKNLGFKTATII